MTTAVNENTSGPQAQHPKDVVFWTLVAGVIALYALAAVPLGVWALHGVDSVNVSVDTISILAVVGGMSAIPVLASLAAWGRAHEDPLRMMVPAIAGLMISLVTISQFLGSEEMQSLRALEGARATIQQAQVLRGDPPPVASRVQAVQSLESAVSNKEFLVELAQASADPESVSQALSTVQSLGDNSDHATFVRENSLLRQKDKEYFARALIQRTQLPAN